MIKKYATKQFKQFLPMIEKAVWHYSRKYHLERSDLEGQAFLIFCEALKTFDKEKASFSTYLTRTLNIKLSSYCITTNKRKYNILRCKESNRRGYGKTNYIKLESTNDILECCSYDIFDKVITRMDYEMSLSNDAKEIVDFIVSRKWEIVDSNWKPRLSYIKRVFCNNGWTGKRVIKGYNEVREWWNSSNKDQFCMEV